MSKELEALERIKDDIECCYLRTPHNDKLDRKNYLGLLNIIENTLKNEDEEKFDLIKQVRELKDEIASLKSFNSKLWVEREQNQKKLKALEIIKVKVMPLVSLDEGEIHKGHYRVYDGELYGYTELTKEEFDLLKEVLL